MTHQMIRRFGMEGHVTDGNIEKHRQELERIVRTDMRDSGFVPLLDLQPSWSTWYDNKEEQMHFKLTIHGVYVGEEAWDIEGIMGQKRIPKSTHPNKSRPS